MFAYSLEHICSYSAQLQNPPEVIGPVPEGLRVNFYVTSGEVTGPKIRGILRPVGGTGSPFAPMGSGSWTSVQRSKRTITLSSSSPTQAWGTSAKTAITSFSRGHCPPGCHCAWYRVSRPRTPNTSGSIACSVSILVRWIWNALKSAMTYTLSGSLQGCPCQDTKTRRGR